MRFIPLFTLLLTAGLAAQTRHLDFAPGAGRPDPTRFVALPGQVLFLAKTSTTGTEIFKTDGTLAGTGLVLDGTPGPASSFTYPPYSFGTRVGDRAVFLGISAQHQASAWISDGTANGTSKLADIPVQTFYDFDAFEHDGVIWLLVEGQLYRSDGTAAGTSRVFPGGRTGKVIDPTALGDALLLAVSDPAVFDHHELLRLDPRTGAVTVVRDFDCTAKVVIKPDPAGGRAIVLEWRLWTCSTNPGTQLMITDGTVAGTRRLRAFSIVDTDDGPWFDGDRVLLLKLRDWATQRYDLVIVDITSAATQLLATVTTDGTHLDLGRVQGRRRLYIDSPSPRLVSTDGTPAGTTIESFPVRISTSVHGIALSVQRVGDQVVFLGFDLIEGSELWATDGTVAGTRMVYQIRPGYNGWPSQMGRALLDNAGEPLFVWAAATNSLARDLYVTPIRDLDSAVFESLRDGCAGTTPAPSLDLAAAPRLTNSPLRFEFAGADAGGPVVLVFGASLGPNLPGCGLDVVPFASLPFTADPAGRLTVDLTLAPDPAYIGQRFFIQGLAGRNWGRGAWLGFLDLSDARVLVLAQ